MSWIFSPTKAIASEFRTLKPGLILTTLKIFPGQNSIVTFSDGNNSATTCLHCPTAPCHHFSELEVVSKSIPSFPADRNLSVCPSDAIVLTELGAPYINPENCIFCGVCASRCPLGAIKLAPYAVVNDDLNEFFLCTSKSDETEATLASFTRIEPSGVYLIETDSIVDHLKIQMQSALARIGDRFPDLLARNLLITVGVGASMRRKGDNAARIDIVLGPPWPSFGCAEVEFGDTAILDAPRDLMDDVAVSVSRHNKDKAALISFIITDVLPNRRSEYWRIIQDVRTVLGLQFDTLTVLALCLLVWNRIRIADLPPDLFHVDIDTESYRETVLERMLNRRLRISSDARSMVEVAK